MFMTIAWTRAKLSQSSHNHAPLWYRLSYQNVVSKSMQMHSIC